MITYKRNDMWIEDDFHDRYFLDIPIIPRSVDITRCPNVQAQYGHGQTLWFLPRWWGVI